MTATIQQLAQGTPTQAASIPFYDTANGADRKASVTEFAALLQTLLASAASPAAQYAAPNATGFSVAIVPPSNGASVLLILSPAAGYAAGTIVLPAKETCIDGQEISVTCTQTVTTLTVSGNGATVNNAPTSFNQSGSLPFMTLRFDGVMGAWYRVG